jgi:Domain of unknown function (DUF4136)
MEPGREEPMFIEHIKRSLAAIALLAGVGLLAACSGLSVSTERAPNADFTGRKTFAWVPNPQDGGRLDASIAGQRIHAEVEQALLAHGFTPASGQPPDMLVDYRVMLQERTEVSGGAGWGDISTYNYTVGTLIVMVQNPKDGLVLWRGIAEGTVPSAAGATGEDSKIPMAVQEMFARFPN